MRPNSCKPAPLFAVSVMAAGILAACSPSTPSTDSPQPEKPATETSSPETGDGEIVATEQSENPRLTVYSGDYEVVSSAGAARPGMPGYALVERPLRFQLDAGSNEIDIGHLPPAMDVEAATLQAEARGTAIQGQRYVAPLSGTADVLGRAIGRRVSVEHTAGSAKQTDSGILLAADDGLSLALNDGRIKVIRNYDNFSIIAGNDTLPRQATLQWTLEAEQAGDAAFTLGYPMGGMAWQAEYRATVESGKDCKLSLDGAALVVNRSGVDFDDARLTLVAGEPKRVRRQIGFARAEARDMAANAAAEPIPSPRRAGEYHAYELPGTSRIGNGAVERLPLFAPRPAVECQRDYVVNAGTVNWEPPRPMIDANQNGPTGFLPVNVTVSFDNNRDTGLGQPLPAGRVRMFDGSDFLGESMLGHTPEGDEIRLQVGKAFDLSATREATRFDVDRNGRRITESFTITLRNAKDEDTRVRVLEPMQRWRDWDITASSVPAKKKDAHSVEFEVSVPAKGEARLTYTVRYQWPEGVRP